MAHLTRSDTDLSNVSSMSSNSQPEVPPALQVGNHCPPQQRMPVHGSEGQKQSHVRDDDDDDDEYSQYGDDDDAAYSDDEVVAAVPPRRQQEQPMTQQPPHALPPAGGMAGALPIPVTAPVSVPAKKKNAIGFSIDNIINGAVDRYKSIDPEKKEAFKQTSKNYAMKAGNTTMSAFRAVCKSRTQSRQSEVIP